MKQFLCLKSCKPCATATEKSVGVGAQLRGSSIGRCWPTGGRKVRMESAGATALLRARGRADMVRAWESLQDEEKEGP